MLISKDDLSYHVVGGHAFEPITQERRQQKIRAKRIKAKKERKYTRNKLAHKTGLENEIKFGGMVQNLIKHKKISSEFIGIKKANKFEDHELKFDFKLFVEDPVFGKRFIKIQTKTSESGAIYFMEKYHDIMCDIYLVIMDESMDELKLISELENIHLLEKERLRANSLK